MKCLIILGILSMTDLPFVDSDCTCDKNSANCSDVHKCVNCELVDYSCKEYHNYIATENECVNLLTKSTSYNGIEWKSDSHSSPCRTINCTDVRIRQNDNDNKCRTVYWKACNAGCRTSVFIESITDLPIPTATPTTWPDLDSKECILKCFPPSQNCTAIYNNNNCTVYRGYNSLGSVQTVAAGSTASTLSCTEMVCSCLPNPYNGYVNASAVIHVGTTALYSCRDGYALSGSSTLTCGADGNWSASPPKCKYIDCGAPIAPPNGYVNFTSTTLTSQAYYSCDEGFDLHGITNITCEANGSWSDSQVICLIKNCHVPTSPLNGSVNYTSTSFKSQANFSCDEGFDLSGSTNTTCEANGNWSDLGVVCLMKDCDTPTPPTNGFVNYSATKYDSRANYSCDEGYDLNGTTYTTCGANGNWSDMLPSCLIKDCLAPFPPLNGSVSYTSTTYNSQATYSCKKGFDLNGSTHTTCGANGNWSDPFPTCTIKDCRAPIPPVNGSVNFTLTTYNSQAIYSCDQGYHHGGSTQTTCRDNGNWTNIPPNCSFIDCKEPSQVINGDVVFNETTYGKHALYSCHQGFSIHGPKTLTCQVNGRWVPDIKPSCLAPGSKKKPLYIVPCNCCPNKTFTNMTQDEILAHLVNETRIDTKNTSAALDKLRSRSDSRTSSAVIGTVAIVILSTLGGLIVCSDLITICRKRNARRKSE